jgi:Cof subfamily protein (haloacid dehalogenase superfamily)
MTRHRLIAIDLDGTLLDPEGRLSQRSVDAIERRADRGDRVVLATGRPPDVALEATRDLAGTVSHVIGANGTIIGTFPATPDAAPEILHVRGFDYHDAQRIVSILRDYDDRLGFAIATDHGFAHEGGFSALMPAAVTSASVDDVLAIGGSTAFKLLVFHPETRLEALLSELPPVVDEIVAGFTVAHMGAEAAEIGPTGNDKCAGLQWLCAHLGVERSDVIAIGDELNDLRMIEWAGHGVAMANAGTAVHAAADETIGSNRDDGVAVYLEQLDPG